jgi:hypothetical protein
MKSLLSARTSILKLKTKSEQSLSELRTIGNREYKTMHKYFKKIIKEQKAALKRIKSDLKQLIASDEKLAEDHKIIYSVEEQVQLQQP